MPRSRRPRTVSILLDPTPQGFAEVRALLQRLEESVEREDWPELRQQVQAIRARNAAMRRTSTP